MDVYSRPIRTKRGRLTKVFYMKSRRNPKKPGRELIVAHDDRFPLIKGFKLRYSYYVRFFKKGSIAGNHYHHRKEELFIPIKGSFAVSLKDIRTKEGETIKIDSKNFPVMFIKKKVAHKVVSLSKDSILLVMATYAGTAGDECPYLPPDACSRRSRWRRSSLP